MMAIEYWTKQSDGYRPTHFPEEDIRANKPVVMLASLDRYQAPPALAYVAEPGPLSEDTDWGELAKSFIEARGLRPELQEQMADFFATNRGAFKGPGAAEKANDRLRERIYDRKWRGKLWCTRLGKLVSPLQAERVKGFESIGEIEPEHLVAVDTSWDFEPDEVDDLLATIQQAHADAGVEIVGLSTANYPEIALRRVYSLKEILALRAVTDAHFEIAVDDDSIGEILVDDLKRYSRRSPYTQTDDELLDMVIERLQEMEAAYEKQQQAPRRKSSTKRFTHTQLNPLPPRFTLCGLKGKAIQRFTRRIGDGDQTVFSTFSLLGLSDCTERMGDAVLDDLEELGVMVRHPITEGDQRGDNPLTLGTPGEHLAGAVSSTYTRGGALRALERFLANAEAMNADPNSLYEVHSAVVFGSLLRGNETVGDVDVGIILRPRDPETFLERRKAMQDAEKAKRTEKEWWQFSPDYVMKNTESALSGNSPILNFSHLEETRTDVLESGAIQVFFQKTRVDGALEAIRDADEVMQAEARVFGRALAAGLTDASEPAPARSRKAVRPR